MTTKVQQHITLTELLAKLTSRQLQRVTMFVRAILAESFEDAEKSDCAEARRAERRQACLRSKKST